MSKALSVPSLILMSAVQSDSNRLVLVSLLQCTVERGAAFPTVQQIEAKRFIWSRALCFLVRLRASLLTWTIETLQRACLHAPPAPSFVWSLPLHLPRVCCSLFALAVAARSTRLLRQPTRCSRDLCQDAWSIFIPSTRRLGRRVAGRKRDGAGGGGALGVLF